MSDEQRLRAPFEVVAVPGIPEGMAAMISAGGQWVFWHGNAVFECSCGGAVWQADHPMAPAGNRVRLKCKRCGYELRESTTAPSPTPGKE